jgi:excisionase family DNA binding protein
MTDPITTQIHAALSVAAGAAELGVGIPTLRKMITRRQIPHVRVNRRVLLLRDDIRAYLAAHRVPAKGEPEQAKRTGPRAGR